MAVDSTKKYWWAGAVAVPILVAAIGVLPSFLGGGASGDTVISNSRVGDDLYLTTNVEISDPEARSRFDQAIAFARDGLFAEAKALFEQLAPTVQAAGVYNNLAVVNAALGDDLAAQRSVQQALQLDPVDRTAQQNLTLISRAIKEQRSNDTILTATPIQLGRNVDSRLGDANDSDFFSFTAPAGSRDILRIQVENKATTFAPYVRVFDSARAELTNTYQSTLGANVMLNFVAAPGAAYYVQVTTANGDGGAYMLSITPQKAFDRFEPNDDILKPAELSVGRDVEAGIMDPIDQDLYRVALAAGTVRVVLNNRSSGLAPDILVYDENKSEVTHQYNTTPGANVSAEGAASRPGTWYVRVGASSGSGQYTLRVEQ
jgi:hypothetical protein